VPPVLFFSWFGGGCDLRVAHRSVRLGLSIMTVLHFCTSDSWGGLEVYACTLMDELRTAGLTVGAVCKPGSKVEAYLKAHNIQRTYLPAYSSVSLRSIRFLRSLIRQNGVDAVHVHFHRDIWPASFALRGDGHRKLFVSVYMGISGKNDIWHRYIHARVDGFFTSSKLLNDRFPRLYGVPKDKIHFLPYGRRLGQYAVCEEKRRTIRSSLAIGPDEILVGTMVRIDPGKGVMDFAESFLYLGTELQQKVRYLIVGEPTRKGNAKPGEPLFEPHCEEYLRRLQTYVAEHGLEKKIYLVGFQDDVIGYLSAMDIFVFPSRDELYSLVMLDAMAMSLPIVAAGASGNLEQVEDGVNGFLYNVADSKHLAARLSIYMRDSDIRLSHGAAARKYAEEHHDMKNTIARLTKYYQLREGETC